MNSPKREDILALLLAHFREQHIMSDREINKLITKARESKEEFIPLYIFKNHKLSALETITKYLFENKRFTFSMIAKLLNRNTKTIWATYKNSRKKYRKEFHWEHSEIDIPAAIFRNRNLSPLENLVFYLKQNENLKFVEIAKLIKRNQKTVWTAFNRAKKKLAKQ